LFSVSEDSGRQSRSSWGGSLSGRDYLVEELRYMREAGPATPSFDLDASFTPSVEDADTKYLLRLDSRPLADDGMTPGTSIDIPGLQQQQRHALSDDVQALSADKNARRAVVLLFNILTFT